jgi:hypothetical protein
MTQSNFTAVISPGANYKETQAQSKIQKDDLSFTIFANDVPAFTESELDRLYHSAYASMEHLRVYGGAENASTYVARNSDQIVDLLLFRIEGRRAQVLNEMIAVDNAMANRFARAIFERYPAVNLVSFKAVQAKLRAPSFPFQIVKHSEDIVVVSLPDTPDEYLARFGKATRKNIKQHVTRAQRDLPGFSFQVHSGRDIAESDLRAIVALNHARMRDKGKTSYLDEAETQRLLQIVRSRGAIATIRVEGRICAGAIYALYGGTYFSYVNAHDPQYDAHRLGTVCSYLTICDCIGRGSKEFHFRWGRYQYKHTLQGEHQDLSEILIYRSRWAVVRSAATAARSAFDAALHDIKYWLLTPERLNNPFSLRALDTVKKSRRMLTRSA